MSTRPGCSPMKTAFRFRRSRRFRISAGRRVSVPLKQRAIPTSKSRSPRKPMTTNTKRSGSAILLRQPKKGDTL